MAQQTAKPMRQQMEDHIISLQNDIVAAFEALDPKAPPFKRDSWIRPEGGKGISCVFANPYHTESSSSPAPTTVLEKAGVNISIVHGTLPPAAVRQMRADHASIPINAPEGGLPFFAAGLSLVIHPTNPHAPTVHANYRYFEITAPPAKPTTAAADAAGKDNEGGGGGGSEEIAQPPIITWWFGGGSDLTPSYLYEDDARHFHQTLKDACDAHGSLLHPAFKKWCDEYFYIPHRGEARGIGGIFFDDLGEDEHARIPTTTITADTDTATATTTGTAGEIPTSTPSSLSSIGSRPRPRPYTTADIFGFVKSISNAFIPSYLPILSRRHPTPYTPEQRRFQLIRRGRYVEFNLVCDRGTKFGLATPGARIESVLMSLPETARWEYMSELSEVNNDTEEGKLMRVLKTPIDWI